MAESREILLYLALKHKGDWRKIYDFLNQKEEIDLNDLTKTVSEYKGSDFITILDEDYPEYLKRINCPPFVLFYKGNKELLKAKNRLGVIGSREPSGYGIKACMKLCKDIAENKIVTVSGLAKGIDSIGQETILKNGGLTIGVVGNGIDINYPPSSSELYSMIIDYGGLIISEYPDSIEPSPNKFVERNRIISAISEKLLVIEAHSKSGTQITVSYALYQGRDVMCVPSSVFIDSQCNKFIKQGAILVESIDDILQEFSH